LKYPAIRLQDITPLDVVPAKTVDLLGAYYDIEVPSRIDDGRMFFR